MLQVASWVRECDQELFGRFIARRPGVELLDARFAPLDLVDLEAVHGLLLTGGADISAEFHNEPLGDLSKIHDPDPARDAWEFPAVRRAYERGLPILCICKGVQVLNLALGGSLMLDIAGHNLPEMKSHNVQPLRYEGAARHRFELVNSSHHQALDRVADTLTVEAWHAGDGIVEQVRIENYPWGVGVQYHPERDFIYAPLFDDFLAQMKT